MKKTKTKVLDTQDIMKKTKIKAEMFSRSYSRCNARLPGFEKHSQFSNQIVN